MGGWGGTHAVVLNVSVAGKETVLVGNVEVEGTTVGMLGMAGLAWQAETTITTPTMRNNAIGQQVFIFKFLSKYYRAYGHYEIF